MSRVYFAAADGRIKIGFTSRPVADRLKAISAHLPSPLELIGDIPGSLLLERAIQRELIQFRLNGEWFRDCEEIRNAIRLIIERPQLPLSSRKVVSGLAPREQTPEEYGLMTAQMANMLWPNDALRGMATFTGLTEEECQGWFAGTFIPSEIIRYAFAARVVEYVTERHAEETKARH